MRLFFTKKELKLRKKRVIMMIACMTVLLAGYLILTWPKKIQPELPTVIVEPAEVGDVEIFGEYVGRIRDRVVYVHNSLWKSVHVWKAIWRVCFLPKGRI